MKNFYLKFSLLSYLFFCCHSLAMAQSDYNYIDPDKIIPAKHLKSALDYFDQHKEELRNDRYVGIIDFRQHNSKERFYIIDMQSGAVETHLAAHGRNSDPDFDGYATLFSNTPDSLKTSLGFFLTAETYVGGNGYSLRLDGLSKTNSNARVRAIVIHGASYVAPGEKIGRSYGCPALEMSIHQDVIDRIKGGALLFAAF